MSAPRLGSADEVRQRRVSKEDALRYKQSRDPKRYGRTAEEEKMVRGWMQSLPKNAIVWDCPCGTGRFVPTAVEMGLRYAGGDFSGAMIGHAREASTSPQVLGFAVSDAERLPLRDNSVDCVLLWRLLHHIVEPDVRVRMLREAARVTRHQVLVSFHHPISFTFVGKFFRRKLGRAAPGMPEITHWRLQREAESCGLRVVETRGFRKFVSINWFACLRKLP